MKKLLLIVAVVACCNSAKAQEIGARWGDVVGNDWAFDFIASSGQFARIHGDVSFGTGVGVELLWDFQYRPLKGEAFYWYIGAGPTVLFHDNFLLGASGEIGLEYRFNNAPISIGIDWRPTLYLIDDVDFRAEGFGLNVRYVLGKK